MDLLESVNLFENSLIGLKQKREVILQAPIVRTIYTQFPEYEQQFQIKIVEPDWEMMLEINHWHKSKMSGSLFYFCVDRASDDSRKQYPLEVFRELLPLSCTQLCFQELASIIVQELRQNNKLKVRINLGKVIFNQKDESGEVYKKIMGGMADVGKLSKNMNEKRVRNTFSTSVPSLAQLKVKIHLIDKLKFKEKISEKTVFTLYVTHKPENSDKSCTKIIPVKMQYVMTFSKAKEEQSGNTVYKMQKIRFGYKMLKRMQFLRDYSGLDVNFKAQVERELSDVSKEIQFFCNTCVRTLNQNGLHSEFKKLFDVQTDDIKIETIRRKKKCILEGYFQDCLFKVSLAKSEINSYVNKQSEIGFWCKDLNFIAARPPAALLHHQDALHQNILNSLHITHMFYQELADICGKVSGFSYPQNQNLQNNNN